MKALSPQEILELDHNASLWLRGVKIASKADSRFMRFLGWLLKPICPTFMTDYFTTIGDTIYTPDGSSPPIAVLHHESIHIYDHHRVGNIPFMLSYLFALPAIWTYRAHWESRAYTLSILYWIKEGIDPEIKREMLLKQFTGPAYFFMCPFKSEVDAWITETIANAREALYRQELLRL